MKRPLKIKSCILFNTVTSAQVQVQKPVTAGTNKPVLNTNNKLLSVTDSDWAQKSTLLFKPNPFKCELWITTDGILLCKTDVELSDTSVFFLMPTVNSAKDEKGASYGAGGGYGVEMNFKKLSDSDEYTWSIPKIKWGTEKEYNELHAITLTAYNDKGQKGIFNLINKKVPENI